MAEDTLVSVIVPVHNGAWTLRQCLEALSRLEGDRHELIVVNDGSSDGSRAVAGEFPVRLIDWPNQRGAAAARNAGAREAKGSILLFVDADVVLPPNSLVLVRQACRRHSHSVGVLGVYAREQPGGFLSQYKNFLYRYNELYGGDFRPPWHAAVLALRRDDFWQERGFDSGLESVCEDTELGLRMAAKGLLCYVERGLEVVHLKKYGLWGLLRADLRRSMVLANLLLTRSPRETAGYRQAAGSAPFWAFGLPVATLAGFALALFYPLSLLASGIALLAFYLLQRRFLAFAVREKGLAFAVMALPMLWLETLIAALAAAMVAGRLLSKKVKP